MIRPNTLYGVLDLARAPELHEHVQRLAPHSSQCLYEGKLHPEIERHCPHLVELEPRDPLSREWRGRGWGQSWGMLMASREPLSAVRRRLRHFTHARLPSGEGPVLFRFWDPRVFRVYMPLVEPEALPGWFKDIDRYIVETEDGTGSLRYELKGGELVVTAGPRPQV